MANTLRSHARERRLVPRYKLALPIEVRVIAKLSRFLHSTTRDVSSRGVYFVVDQELLPGSEIDLRLTLPGEPIRGPNAFVEARGRVVRTDAKTENGTERFGVGACIDSYYFARTQASSL
jgi:hypothetical protein